MNYYMLLLIKKKKIEKKIKTCNCVKFSNCSNFIEQINKLAVNNERSEKCAYLIQDRFPLLGVSNSWQLHVPHFLHLLIHVYLLFQFLDFCTKQTHSILPVVLACDSSCTCWVNGCYPVLQLRLAAGLCEHKWKRAEVRQQTSLLI